MIRRLEVELAAPGSRLAPAASDLNLALGLEAAASELASGQREALAEAAWPILEGEVRRLWGRRTFTAHIETEGAVKVLPAGGWRPAAHSVTSASDMDGERTLTASERALDDYGRLTLPGRGFWRVAGSIGEDTSAVNYELPAAVNEALIRVMSFCLREGFLRTEVDSNVQLNVSARC